MENRGRRDPGLRFPVNLTGSSRVVVTRNQVSCDLDGETAILNLENGVYYGLNPVGARIWNFLQEPRTFAEIHGALLEDYEVEAARLETDLRILVEQLAAEGLVEIVI